MIESATEMRNHLREQRDVFAYMLEMYEEGSFRFDVGDVDYSEAEKVNLANIVANIDQMLERVSGIGSDTC